MKNVKALFVVLSVFAVSFAGNLYSGGTVPVINSVSSIGLVTADISSSRVNETIAVFEINNNTEGGFILTLEFLNGGRFVNSATGSYVQPFDLILTPIGTGRLGDGIDPLVNKDLLPLLDNRFVWESGRQFPKVTSHYGMKILASWNSDESLLAGLYQETIITRIQAVF